MDQWRIPCCLLLLVLPLASSLQAAETISGQACYRFSDNESIAAARDIALSLAKRDALERYAVFVDSTTTVENAALKNDLITSLTGAVFRNLKVTDQKEDLQGREVCRSIVAEVEPVEVKSQVVAKINAFRIRSANVQTGLPENDRIRVLKTDQKRCLKGNDYFEYERGDLTCLRIVAQCKSRYSEYGNWSPVRVTWYDSDGIPDKSFAPRDRYCKENPQDIINVFVPLPPAGYTWSIDLP
jgi:hypothetical protein